MPGMSYWERRAREREARWTKKCRDELEKELARYYASSLRSIEKDILALYGTFAADNGLTLQNARKLLHGQEFREWRMGMRDYIEEIHRLEQAGDYIRSEGLMRELNTLAMRSRISRLDKLRSETLRELDSLGRKRETAMSRFLTDAYRDNYYRNTFDIGKAGEFKGSFAKADPKQVENILRTPWSGKNYSERIWKDMRKLEGTIRDVVVQGVHRGVSAPKMTKMVMERMGVSKSNAERLVRTELCYVQNQASLESIKDSGMGFYRVSAAFDKRTCSTCAAKDGKEIPVEEASPGDTMPPFHARCRCTIAASFGDGKERKGKKIARDGEGKNIRIPADMSYADWKAVYIDKTKTLQEWEVSKEIKKNPTTRTNSAVQAVPEDAIMKPKGGASSVTGAVHRELAVVNDNGAKGAYRVNYDLVNTKAYHDRFEGLTGRKAVDEALYRRAARMLEHRSGSPYEDIAMLDARTGDVLVENTSASGMYQHRCSLSREQSERLEATGRYFEILHNHPGSSLPSTADIRGLFIRLKAVGSTVVCHNGDVHRMEKLKHLEDVDELIDAAYRDAKETYPNWSDSMIEDYVAESLLEQLSRADVLRYISRR